MAWNILRTVTLRVTNRASGPGPEPYTVVAILAKEVAPSISPGSMPRGYVVHIVDNVTVTFALCHLPNKVAAVATLQREIEYFKRKFGPIP